MLREGLMLAPDLHLCGGLEHTASLYYRSRVTAAMDGAPVRTSPGAGVQLGRIADERARNACSFRQSLNSSIPQNERNVLAAELQDVSVSGGSVLEMCSAIHR